MASSVHDMCVYHEILLNIADKLDAQELLGSSFRSGILFANPIPSEFAIPREKIDAAIDEAVREAASNGIYGHANTPYILARIKDLTAGGSVTANRALIESNVRLATRVAATLAGIRRKTRKQPM